MPVSKQWTVKLTHYRYLGAVLCSLIPEIGTADFGDFSLGITESGLPKISDLNEIRYRKDRGSG
jgi:hypothetical protein